MLENRKHFLKAMLKVTIKVLSVGGSVIGSAYDTGAALVNDTSKTLLRTTQTGLKHSINESRKKIIHLRYEISKESARLKLYSMLKKIQGR